jgi:hypothetical protein
MVDVGADPPWTRGRPPSSHCGERLDPSDGPTGVMATACPQQESDATRETPGGGDMPQPDAREGQAGLPGESERLIVLTNSGNAEGGKGPQFQANGRSGDSRESGVSLEPPLKVGKSQASLHAATPRGDRMRSGPRAGCGQSARPVRRAGGGNGAGDGY